MLKYVGTRMAGATTFRVQMTPLVPGWASDIADLLRETGAYAEVRVFPAEAVDRLIATGAIPAPVAA